MKKIIVSFILTTTLVMMVGCSNEDTKNEEIQQSTTAIEETSQTEKTQQSTATTSTIVITEETSQTEENTNSIQFNSLSKEIQSVMVTTLVDSRIFGVITPTGHDEPSYFLNSSVGSDFWKVNVHSGRGVGHPFYLIAEDDSYVWPVFGMVVNDINKGYEEIPVETQKVAKMDLYNQYMEDKEYFDSIQVYLGEVDYSLDEELENMMQAVEYSNE